MAQAQPSLCPWLPAPSTTPAAWNRSASLAARSRGPGSLGDPSSTPRRHQHSQVSRVLARQPHRRSQGEGLPAIPWSPHLPAVASIPPAFLGAASVRGPYLCGHAGKGTGCCCPRNRARWLGPLGWLPHLQGAQSELRQKPSFRPHAGHSTHSPRTLGPRTQAGMGVGSTFTLEVFAGLPLRSERPLSGKTLSK